MTDAVTSELLEIVRVRARKRRETARINWLDEVAREGWHAETPNLVLFTVLAELRRSRAAAAP